MPEKSHYNWEDEDTEEVKRPQKPTDPKKGSNKDKAENARRDIVADNDVSHRGMDDDNEPHALEPRQRDLEQSKISDHDVGPEPGIEDHDQPYFGNRANDHDEEVDRRQRGYYQKDHPAKRDRRADEDMQRKEEEQRKKDNES